MFERYTQAARLAIFYGAGLTALDGAPKVDSIHLLRGLVWPKKSRADVLFHLREKLPQYSASPGEWALRRAYNSQQPTLTDESKKILARAAMEADAISDAWVDTDHLLLGILAEPDSQAAQELNKAGITLENARQVVLNNRPSRPDYGPVIPLGQSQTLRGWLTWKWKKWTSCRS